MELLLLFWLAENGWVAGSAWLFLFAFVLVFVVGLFIAFPRNLREFGDTLATAAGGGIISVVFILLLAVLFFLGDAVLAG